MEFTIPSVIRDFVFDLYSSSRKSQRLDEVISAYEVKFKDLADRYFAQSPWPSSESISSECRDDEEFLIFYKEMTARHFLAKLKPHLSDFILSWTTYTKLFSFVLTSDQPEIVMTAQWVSDITQEFVYQFQGFCQYRSQPSSRTPEDIDILDANRDVWSLPTVLSILKNLIAAGKKIGVNQVHVLFACFASVELARLECLIGDYGASITALSPSTLGSRAEFITAIPSCHANVFYHTGVSQLMLRQHSDAVRTFSDALLLLHALVKPASTLGSRGHTPLQKVLEKMLALLTVASSLCPGARLTDQAKDLMESKFGDKLRRIQNGDLTTLTEMFENACPKFINPSVPDYSVIDNLNQEAFAHQIATFAIDAGQILSVLKIRSYLQVYASIDVENVARMSNTTSSAVLSQLISYKQKTLQYSSAGGNLSEPGSQGSIVQNRVSTSEVQYLLVDTIVSIEQGVKQTKNDVASRFFVSSTRKQADIVNDLNKHFARYGL